MSDKEWMRAPFPWFGGKARVGALVWSRFDAVRGYVEPFAGSLAVLLARPHEPGVETVNDKDRFVCNVWRALAADPEAVAAWADWPVNEVDLRARHDWLVTVGRDRLARLDDDPDDFDAKIAGWWLWGIACWIGSGWCPEGRTARGALGNAGQGVNRQLPHLGNAGQGVNRQLPHLGNAGRGAFPCSDWFAALAERLKRVRVCCGDWKRVTGPSVLFGGAGNGPVGVLLDPPYSGAARTKNLYGTDDNDVAAAARAWAIEHGEDHRLRIALCGYEGEHAMPETWECVAWKARGGYGSQGSDDNAAGRANARKERIWFSPGCLRPEPPA